MNTEKKGYVIADEETQNEKEVVESDSENEI